MGETAQRGPKAPRGEVADGILAHAREAFATDGYAGTSLQGIARAAGVDTKLIRYYFGGKQSLFDACLAFPEQLLERIHTAVDVALPHRGEAVVRAMLSVWSHPDLARVLRTSLLIAAHEPAAMARVRAVFSDGLIPAVSDGIDPAEISVRGGLVSTHLIGVAFARFIFVLDDAAAIPDAQLISSVGATLQRYLTGPLATSGGSPSR